MKSRTLARLMDQSALRVHLSLPRVAMSLWDVAARVAPSAHCMDCGCAYGGPLWLDFVLPHEQWLLIHPGDGGVLCANCIIVRASKLPRVIGITGRIAFGDDFVETSSVAPCAKGHDYQNAMDYTGNAFCSRCGEQE